MNDMIAHTTPLMTLSAIVYRACEKCGGSKPDHDADLLACDGWDGKTEDVGILASSEKGTIKWVQLQ